MDLNERGTWEAEWELADELIAFIIEWRELERCSICLLQKYSRNYSRLHVILSRCPFCDFRKLYSIIFRFTNFFQY